MRGEGLHMDLSMRESLFLIDRITTVATQRGGVEREEGEGSGREKGEDSYLYNLARKSRIDWMDHMRPTAAGDISLSPHCSVQ